jgi:hypothetical protein
VSVGCQAKCISPRAFSRWSLVAIEGLVRSSKDSEGFAVGF